MDLPSEIFKEASLVLQSIDTTDTGILPLSDRGSEIEGGVIAEALNMVALETTQLSIPPPEVGCLLLSHFPSPA